MKASKRIVAWGIVSSVAAGIALLACTGDDPDRSVTDPPDGATANDASQTEAPCEDYCNAVQTNCTGDLAIYSGGELCRKTCRLLPLARPGAVDKDTIGCRVDNARVGKNRDVCNNASAYGGESCSDDKCRTFCNLVSAVCKDVAAPPYSSTSSCYEACRHFHYDPKKSEGMGKADDGNDTLNCRMFHLLLALDDGTPAGTNDHCGHVKPISTTCLKPVLDGGADAAP